VGQSVITKISNLFLKNRRIEFTPIKPYASLREAREKFSESEVSFIAAHLHAPGRTFFTENP
jgi:hypothetical protein